MVEENLLFCCLRYLFACLLSDGHVLQFFEPLQNLIIFRPVRSLYSFNTNIMVEENLLFVVLPYVLYSQGHG
jgi:hypothetical protein